jgi:CheY-like chemotaxis protein
VVAGPRDREARSCRILVADDNEDAAVSLAMMLELMGNVARTARDGLEAVQLADTFTPDVAFLDLGMPRLDGYETARRLRQQPWSGSLILVAMTGWSRDEDRERTQQAGFDFHIVKPAGTDVLHKLLDDVHCLRGKPRDGLAAER